jgi:hypothetical protein
MSVVGAFGRWIKALGYLLTGRIDSAREVLDRNPHVVRAKYDAVIREKVDRIQQYKQAVASLVAQQERKVQQVSQLSQEVQSLENLKTGAAAKAKQAVARLQQSGRTMDQIKEDGEYKKCLAAFNDFSSTLQEKQARIAELEQAIGEYRKSIGDHKVQLQQLLRDIEGLKSEAAEAVADMITSREEREIGDMLAGIAKDGTAEELQQMRDMRNKVKAEAKISKEMAGIDTRAQEAEFLEYARRSESNTEFEALIGMAGKEKAAPEKAAPQKDSKLPE